MVLKTSLKVVLWQFANKSNVWLHSVIWATILHFPMYLHSVSGIESKSCHVLSVVGQEEDHLTR